MDNKIILYHGSEKIIENPIFGAGKKNNDFGLGFYCTESNDLAKEWAVSSLNDGYSNKYTLDTEYLKILNLNMTKENIPDKISVKIDFKENFGKNILKISEDGTIKQVILKMLTSIKIME